MLRLLQNQLLNILILPSIPVKPNTVKKKKVKTIQAGLKGKKSFKSDQLNPSDGEPAQRNKKQYTHICKCASVSTMYLGVCRCATTIHRAG